MLKKSSNPISCPARFQSSVLLARAQDNPDDHHKDGNRRIALEVTASDIQFLGPKGEGAEAKAEPEAARPQEKAAAAGVGKEAARAALKAQAPAGFDDDEIPF